MSAEDPYSFQNAVLRDARRQHEAERALHHAIALLREHGPARMLGIALGNMASLETSRGKYALARAERSEALEYLRLAVAMADDLRLPDSPQREIIRSTGAALEAADTHLMHGHLPEEIGG